MVQILKLRISRCPMIRLAICEFDSAILPYACVCVSTCRWITGKSKLSDLPRRSRRSFGGDSVLSVSLEIGALTLPNLNYIGSDLIISIKQFDSHRNRSKSLHHKNRRNSRNDFLNWLDAMDDIVRERMFVPAHRKPLHIIIRLTDSGRFAPNNLAGQFEPHNKARRCSTVLSQHVSSYRAGR